MDGALLVVLGSALGGMARYGISTWGVRRFGSGFPWSTLFINAAGSFAVGVLFALIAAQPVPPVAQPAHQLVTFGFFGGFTTFSTFALEVLTLAQSGHPRRAGLYASATLVLGLGCGALGYLMVPV